MKTFTNRLLSILHIYKKILEEGQYPNKAKGHSLTHVYAEYFGDRERLLALLDTPCMIQQQQLQIQM